MAKSENGVTTKTQMHVTRHVDVASGVSVQTDFNGKMTISGSGTDQGQNGQPITFTVNGSGSMTGTESVQYTPGNGAAGQHRRGATHAHRAGRKRRRLCADADQAGRNGGNGAANNAGNNAGPAGNPLAGAADLTGTWTSDTLSAQFTGGKGQFNGTLKLNGKSYPATLNLDDGEIIGSFSADANNAFPIEGKLSGDTLTLKTGTTTYTLKKQAVNPLAQPMP